jgi:hypothetical protein
MLKHWLNGRVLCNLLAWGTQTNRWNSRCYGPMEYGKTFDLALDGVHTYRWAVMPHAGTSSVGSVPDIARRFAEPLTGALAPAGAQLPAHPDVLRIASSSSAPASAPTPPSFSTASARNAAPPPSTALP